MKLTGLHSFATAIAALSAPALAWAYDPLPSACEMLNAVDARSFAGDSAGEGDLIEMALVEGQGVRLSGCHLPGTGVYSYGLTLREETGEVRLSGQEQLDDILRQNSEFYGEDLKAEPVEAGEAAAWLPGFHQLWVIARDGHAYLVITVPEDAGATEAAAFTRLILSAYE